MTSIKATFLRILRNPHVPTKSGPLTNDYLQGLQVAIPIARTRLMRNRPIFTTNGPLKENRVANTC